MQRGSRLGVAAASLACAAFVGLAVESQGFAAPSANPAGSFAGCPRGTVSLPRSLATYATSARAAVLRFVDSRASRLKLKVVGAQAKRSSG